MTAAKYMNDHLVLQEMKAAIRKHLQAAMTECAKLSDELQMLDADDLMAAVRKQFDGSDEDSAVQDCFSDAFWPAMAQCADNRGEPVSFREDMPSGAAKGSN